MHEISFKGTQPWSGNFSYMMGFGPIDNLKKLKMILLADFCFDKKYFWKTCTTCSWETSNGSRLCPKFPVWSHLKVAMFPVETDNNMATFAGTQSGNIATFRRIKCGNIPLSDGHTLELLPVYKGHVLLVFLNFVFLEQKLVNNWNFINFRVERGQQLIIYENVSVHGWVPLAALDKGGRSKQASS